MCGCGKKSSASRMPSARTAVGPTSVPGGISAGATPETLRALSAQVAQSPKSAARLDQARLEIMKKRREIIRSKFNK